MYNHLRTSNSADSLSSMTVDSDDYESPIDEEDFCEQQFSQSAAAAADSSGLGSPRPAPRVQPQFALYRTIHGSRDVYMVEDTSRHGAAAAVLLLRQQQARALQLKTMGSGASSSWPNAPHSTANQQTNLTEEELRLYHEHFGMKNPAEIFPSKRYGHSYHIIDVPTGLQLLLVLAGEPQQRGFPKLNDIWVYSIKQRRWQLVEPNRNVQATDDEGHVLVNRDVLPHRAGHTSVVYLHHIDFDRREAVYILLCYAGFDGFRRQLDLWRYALVIDLDSGLVKPPTSSSPSHSGAWEQIVTKNARMCYEMVRQSIGSPESQASSMNRERFFENVMPRERSAHSAVIRELIEEGGIVKKYMVIFGGWNGYVAFDDIWQFDLQLEEWFRVPVEGNVCADKVYTHCACMRDSHRMLVFGGRDVKSPDHRYNSLHEYDFRTCRWTTHRSFNNGPTPVERGGLRCDMLDTDHMVLFGGNCKEGKLADFWIYDFPQQTWRLLRVLVEQHAHLHENKYLARSMFGFVIYRPSWESRAQVGKRQSTHLVMNLFGGTGIDDQHQYLNDMVEVDVERPDITQFYSNLASRRDEARFCDCEIFCDEEEETARQLALLRRPSLQQTFMRTSKSSGGLLAPPPPLPMPTSRTYPNLADL